MLPPYDKKVKYDNELLFLDSCHVFKQKKIVTNHFHAVPMLLVLKSPATSCHNITMTSHPQTYDFSCQSLTAVYCIVATVIFSQGNSFSCF